MHSDYSLSHFFWNVGTTAKILHEIEGIWHAKAGTQKSEDGRINLSLLLCNSLAPGSRPGFSLPASAKGQVSTGRRTQGGRTKTAAL